MLIAWYEHAMILSNKQRDYFKSLQSKVTQGMAQHKSRIPYYLDKDHVIRNYEVIREVWWGGASIQSACTKHKLSRSQFYEKEDLFVQHGTIGLFPEIKSTCIIPDLERLAILINKARPSVSIQGILRFVEAVPNTQKDADLSIVSHTLASYGRSPSNKSADHDFWSRIQRTINQYYRLKELSLKGRNKKKRKKTFFVDNDPYHKRLELLRELFFNPSAGVQNVCMQYGIALTNYYRLIKDYRLFGPWAIIPAHLPGKESMSSETELNIILKKLQYPYWSAQKIVNELKLRCSRFAVNRVFKRWELTDKNRTPIAIDHFCSDDEIIDEPYKNLISAYHLHSEETLLESKRINRHFELICKKMQTHTYHLCDPGPLLLAPFINELGIVQAMESYGPIRLRGEELSNLALLNVFRILSGYPRINHLSNNRDRSVAFASGIGIFGTQSRYYQDSLEFKFDQLHSLRCDLVTRSKELKIIEGEKIAFDFHFKKFFGSNSKEKGIGKGPDKAGDLVPGFRPHVAWDLATNTILSMTYYQGGVRAPGILEQYCEQHIFPLFDPRAIREIYMDSEYTKEASLHNFKMVRCPNGEIFICLKKNKQIKNLIAPILDDKDGWKKIDNEDEVASVDVVLPNTKLPLKIVILRDLKTKKNIRCFGSTDMNLSTEDLLQKYRYRWLIENGLKDLVYSYFLDDIYGSDPEKIEFEFYCVMVARLTYEYFLKEIGGEHYHHADGNKTTLQRMRNLLFEKHNFTLLMNSKGNLIVTLLDTNGDEFEQQVAKMLDEKMAQGKNKVLWWGNRGIQLRFNDQYKI